MASKESQIKACLEEYLNLRSSIKDYQQAKEDALKRYHHLQQQHPGNYTYDIHKAAPVINAYEEAKDLEVKEAGARQRLYDLGEKIKEYIHALHDGTLRVRFEFDELNHRAGDHTFFIENEALKPLMHRFRKSDYCIVKR